MGQHSGVQTASSMKGTVNAETLDELQSRLLSSAGG